MPLSLSDYHSAPDVRVLLISIVAGWCVACVNDEPALISLYDHYQQQRPGSVMFLQVILQGAPGQIADQSIADIWAVSQSPSFPVAIDPGAALSRFFDVKSFPNHLVISTPTMNITSLGKGFTVDRLMQAIDASP